MKEKRGLVLSIETMLIIILSIAVLTILIIFLNTQTGFFSDFMDSLRSKSNVDDVVLVCNNLAITESATSYCCEEREVKYFITEGEKQKIKREDLTCEDLRQRDFVSGRIEKLDDCEVIDCGVGG